MQNQDTLSSAVSSPGPRSSLEEYLRLAISDCQEGRNFSHMLHSWGNQELHFVSSILRPFALWVGKGADELCLQASAWRLQPENQAPLWGDVVLYGIPPEERRIGFSIGGDEAITVSLHLGARYSPERHQLQGLFGEYHLTGVWRHRCLQEQQR
jgi:hypothetical protein